MTDDPMVAALLREREGYERQGLTARVALVDEQLKLRGYKPSRDEKEPESDKAPRGRSARPRQQA